MPLATPLPTPASTMLLITFPFPSPAGALHSPSGHGAGALPLPAPGIPQGGGPQPHCHQDPSLQPQQVPFHPPRRCTAASPHTQEETEELARSPQEVRTPL